MLVIAHHDIRNPEKFWGAAKEKTQSLPANLKLHGVYPSSDTRIGTCLWEADSVQEVQQFLDQHVGNYALNTCYQVDAQNSFGLPDLKKQDAAAN